MAVAADVTGADGPRRRGRPRKVDDGGVDTRERLLDAAFEAFLADGHAGVKLADVADRAGVTANAVYHYFDSRSALLVEAAKRALDKVQFPQVEPDSTAQERAVAVVRAFLAPQAAPFRRFVVELNVAAHHDDELATLIDDWNRTTLANWLRLTGRTKRSQARVKALMMLMLGICHHENFRAIDVPDRLLSDELEAIAAALFAD